MRTDQTSVVMTPESTWSKEETYSDIKNHLSNNPSLQKSYNKMPEEKLKMLPNCRKKRLERLRERTCTQSRKEWTQGGEKCVTVEESRDTFEKNCLSHLPYSLCWQQQMDDSRNKIAELGDGNSTDHGSCWNHACSVTGGMILDLKTNSATNTVAGVAKCGLTTWQCSTDAMFDVY